MDKTNESRRDAALVAVAIGSAALAAAVLYSSQRLGRSRGRSHDDWVANSPVNEGRESSPSERAPQPTAID